MDQDTAKATHQPHDKLFFQTLKNKRIAQDAMRSHLPAALLEKADLENIKLYRSKLISPQYKKFEADVIYEVPLLGERGLFMFHCEHQSVPDRNLPLRLWQYLLLLLMEYRENHPDRSLPVVYPMIIYTGETQYHASTDFFSLFGDQKDLARECILQPIRLLDVCRMEDEEIKQHNLFGLSEFAFKYKETQHFKEFLSIFLPWVDEVVFDVGQQYINSLSYYVLYVFKNGSKEQYIKATNRYLSELSKGGSMTIAEQLIEEGMQKGMQKGEQKGMQKGIQQGEQSGLRKGLRQARQQIAVVLLKRQASEEAVSEITGLSLEEVQTLKKDLIDI